MKRIRIGLLTAFAVVFASELSVKAQQSDPPNVEYERLRVLEPLIGTWYGPPRENRDGVKYELLAKASWSPSKKLVVNEYRVKYEHNEEWEPGSREYFVWNHEKDRIERYIVRTRVGAVMVSEIIHDGDGVFRYLPISRTDEGGSADLKVTVTDKHVKIEATNRRDADGTDLEDQTITWQRK